MEESDLRSGLSFLDSGATQEVEEEEEEEEEQKGGKEAEGAGEENSGNQAH
jgi:hypothetical protein